MTPPITQQIPSRALRLCTVAFAAVLAVGTGTTRAQSDRQMPPRDHNRGDKARSVDADQNAFAPGRNGQRRGGGERGGPPPGLWTRLSAQEKEEMLEFIQEHFPKLYLELDRLERMQPQRHIVRMGRIASEIRHLLDVMATNPQRGRLLIKERRLDMETRFLAARFRHAEDDGERDAIRKEMRTLCEEAFDARMERRDLEIRDLEARIVDLRERQEQAADARNELIEQDIEHRLTRPMGRGRPDGRNRERGGPRDDDR